MNFRVIKQLYKKEMLDVLRDKKTVIMMLIVPILIYPLMFVGGMVMMSKVTTQMDTQTYEIAVDFMDTNPELVQMFLQPDDDTLHFKLRDLNVMNADISMILRGEKINAIVYENEDGTGYNIAYLSSVTNSSYAEQKVRQVLEAYSDSLTNQSLLEAGLDPDAILHPIQVEADDRATTEESTGSLLGVIVPFMLVVSLLMGTMYPAIDTTAGERERGTLETILTLPVTNQELIFSKFLTVGTIGIASALLNVLSMGGIGIYVYKLAAQTMALQQGIRISRFVPAILVCALCVLAFAVLISALSMCFCVFAKTYKEANNYITPLMLLVMFASFVGFMPNVSLTRNMALVPVANICLLIRDLLAFKFSFSTITIVLFSNIAYGVIAVLLLGKLYNSEAILFGDGTGNVQIFERRSNMTKGGVPSVGDACLALPIVLVLMIYVGGFASTKGMLTGLLATQGIVAGVPVLMTLYTKKDWKKTFRIRLCRPGFLVGGIFLILGAIALGMIVTSITSVLFPNSADAMTTSMDEIYRMGYGASILIVALLPAVCEELLFRGFLYSSFEARMTQGKAIVLVSVIFGLYHMNVVQSTTTAVIGLAICYLSAQSESLVPGILMHFLNNALSVTLTFYSDAVSKYLKGNSGTPGALLELIYILLFGIVLCIIGTKIVKNTRKKCASIEPVQKI